MPQSDMWQCPKCNKVYKKREILYDPPDPKVIEIASCGRCGNKVLKYDIYKGIYDVK